MGNSAEKALFKAVGSLRTVWGWRSVRSGRRSVPFLSFRQAFLSVPFVLSFRQAFRSFRMDGLNLVRKRSASIHSENKNKKVLEQVVKVKIRR